MPDPSTHTPRADPARAAFVERWADFARALAFYPESNIRVRQALDRLLGALEEARAWARAAGHLRIRVIFRGEEVRAAGETLSVRAGGGLAWLQERLERTGLAGVELGLDVQAPALVGFSRRLLENVQRRELDVSLDALWAETFPGLKPLPRRLGRDAREEDEAANEGQGIGGFLAGLVEGDPELEALARAAVERTGEPGGTHGTRKAGELLEELVHALPPDVLADPDQVRRFLAGALQEIADPGRDAGPALGSPGASAAPPLEGLLLETAQRYFGRAGPSRQILDEDIGPRAAGHEGDAGFEEDAAAFFRELQGLPRDRANPPLSTEAEVPEEQIAVLLYYLARVESPREQSAAERALAELLRRGGEATIDVLRPNVEAALFRADIPRGPQPERRVLELLHRSGLENLLIRTGLLAAHAALEVFPWGFLAFFDAQDLEDAGARRALEDVCRTVGPEGMEALSRSLAGARGLEAPHRLQRLLRRPSKALMPLVAVLVEHGGEEHEALGFRYLAALDLDTPEAEVLELLETPELASRELVLALLRPDADGRAPGAVSDLLSAALCRLLREVRFGRMDVGRRAAAARALGTFRSPEGRRLLEGLVGARRLVILPREPGTVRAAARAALRAYGKEA